MNHIWKTNVLQSRKNNQVIWYDSSGCNKPIYILLQSATIKDNTTVLKESSFDFNIKGDSFFVYFSFEKIKPSTILQNSSLKILLTDEHIAILDLKNKKSKNIPLNKNIFFLSIGFNKTDFVIFQNSQKIIISKDFDVSGDLKIILNGSFYEFGITSHLSNCIINNVKTSRNIIEVSGLCKFDFDFSQLSHHNDLEEPRITNHSNAKEISVGNFDTQCITQLLNNTDLITLEHSRSSSTYIDIVSKCRYLTEKLRIRK